jgi:L-amino acid N-acyltransferase YncA
MTEIADAVAELVTDAGGRARMSKHARSICDGLGTGRVVGALSSVVTDDRQVAHLRKAGPGDRDILLGWQTHPTTRQHFRNPTPPTAEEHTAWFERVTASADSVLDMVMVGDAPVGCVRLDRTINSSAGGYCLEVSIVVAPEHRSRGFGKSALALARLLVPGARLIAKVLPRNDASIQLFRASGYVPCGDWLVSDPHVEMKEATCR